MSNFYARSTLWSMVSRRDPPAAAPGPGARRGEKARSRRGGKVKVLLGRAGPQLRRRNLAENRILGREGPERPRGLVACAGCGALLARRARMSARRMGRRGLEWSPLRLRFQPSDQPRWRDTALTPHRITGAKAPSAVLILIDVVRESGPARGLRRAAASRCTRTPRVFAARRVYFTTHRIRRIRHRRRRRRQRRPRIRRRVARSCR